MGSGINLGFGLVRLNYFGTVVFFLSFPKSSIFCSVGINELSNAFLPVAKSWTLNSNYSHFYFLSANFGSNFYYKYGLSRCSDQASSTFCSNISKLKINPNNTFILIIS